jgi:hypothetical protein
MDGPGQRPSRGGADENGPTMDGFAADSSNRSFTGGVAAAPSGTAAHLMHRAGLLASPRCARPLQYPLHELVP